MHLRQLIQDHTLAIVLGGLGLGYQEGGGHNYVANSARCAGFRQDGISLFVRLVLSAGSRSSGTRCPAVRKDIGRPLPTASHSKGPNVPVSSMRVKMSREGRKTS